MLRLRFPRRWLHFTVLFAFFCLSLQLYRTVYIRPPGFRPDIQQRQNAPNDDLDTHGWTTQTSRMDLSELRRMIAGTKGYYARDWSVGLGWNNLRYIIETSLLHAKLLNRVLVLPSFVYARDCEFPREVCSQYGLFVDRGEAVGWNTWDGAPLSTLAWQLPIQVMLDLPHLRATHPVILASEFMELHGLDSSYESLAGDWNLGDLDTNVTFPTIHTIRNQDYDPSNIVRVDTLRDLQDLDERKKDFRVHDTLQAALGDKLVLEWNEGVKALQVGGWQLGTNAEIERVIISGGWIVLHTFLGAGGMDYSKTVIDPVKEIVPRSRLRGFIDDYSNITDEVLYLEGEIHLGRKPGGLRFTTEKARETFTRLVLFGFRPIAPVRSFAKTLAQRMTARCGGRMWMGAHMRRGDFVAVGWSMEKSLESHVSRVKDRLATGQKILQQIDIPKSYNITGVEPDRSLTSLTPPRKGDPFFLATDEREVKGLQYLRNNSAVIIYDLLTIEDRRSFGWLLLFTDVLGLIEQSLLVHSSFFYGHSLSSFAGGVHNMRAARGADPRTIIID